MPRSVPTCLASNSSSVKRCWAMSSGSSPTSPASKARSIRRTGIVMPLVSSTSIGRRSARSIVSPSSWSGSTIPPVTPIERSKPTVSAVVSGSMCTIGTGVRPRKDSIVSWPWAKSPKTRSVSPASRQASSSIDTHGESGTRWPSSSRRMSSMALRPRSVLGSASAVSVSGVNETSAGAGASDTAAATRSTVAAGSMSMVSTPCESGERASATNARSIRAESVVSSTMTKVTSVSRMTWASSVRSRRTGMAPGSRRRISPISSSGRVIVNRSPDPTVISSRSAMMKFARSEFLVGGFWIVSRIWSGSSIGRNTRTRI